MSITLKSAALALAAFAALPAVGRADGVQQLLSPDLQEVARSTVPNPIVPILLDPSTISLAGGIPLTMTLTAPQRSIFSERYLALVGDVTAQAHDGRFAARSNQDATQQGAWLAQSESHVPAQTQDGQQASAQSNQNVVQQGTWLAAYHPGN